MADLMHYQKMDNTLNDTTLGLSDTTNDSPPTDEQGECTKTGRRSSFAIATSPHSEDGDDSVFIADDMLAISHKEHDRLQQNSGVDKAAHDRQHADSHRLHDRHGNKHREGIPSKHWNNNHSSHHDSSHVHHHHHPPHGHEHPGSRRNPHRVTTSSEVVVQVIDMCPDLPREHHQPDTRPVHKKLSRQVSFKNARAVARQLSSSTRSVARQMSISARTAFRRRKRREKPNSFFNVGVFACFCCFSPLGVVAMVLSALSDIAFDDGEMEKAKRRRISSLVVSIVGIVITLITATVLLFTVAARINA